MYICSYLKYSINGARIGGSGVPPPLPAAISLSTLFFYTNFYAYTQRSLFQILLYQPEIRLFLIQNQSENGKYSLISVNSLISVYIGKRYSTI